MKIHTSHSRKELIQVIQQFKIDIPNCNDLPKKEIQVLLSNKLLSMSDENFKEEDEYFFVKDKSELIEYLSKPNQSKILTIKEKDNVMITAKKIISPIVRTLTSSHPTIMKRLRTYLKRQNT